MAGKHGRIYQVLLIAVLILNSSCERDNDIPEVNTNRLSALPEQVNFPDNNPFSIEKSQLGRLLFWDPILSGSKDVACASCHHPDFGFADGRDLPIGVGGDGLGPSRRAGAVIKRNSPSVINAAFNGIDINGTYNPNAAPMFWDNRAHSLEEQALLPILSLDEMCGDAITEEDILDSVIQRLRAIPQYRALFAGAFGNDLIDDNRIAMAISTFQRTLISNNSRFDQYMRGNIDALDNREIRGMNTFINSGCVDCHSGPMLSDFQLHTLSVPNHSLLEDRGATSAFDFRTPSLRNLNLTAPYMHNGSFDGLRDVLEFYNDISGEGQRSQNPDVDQNQIDQDARNLRLNNDDFDGLLAFLNTLNDEIDVSIPLEVPSKLSVGGNIH
ncbi:MAG: cytochrome c peroxidase [Granulosicoccus sp.]|jgi:cytochrome c peroxidase